MDVAGCSGAPGGGEAYVLGHGLVGELRWARARGEWWVVVGESRLSEMRGGAMDEQMAEVN